MLAVLQLFVSVSLVLGCGAEPPAAGLPRQTAARRVESARLCLELQAPQEKVHLGEPFSVIASIVNCTSTAQDVQDLLSPEFGFLQVWIRRPDGQELLHKPIANRDARGKPTRSLAPGARLSAFVPVYFGPDGWTIGQPGRYRFRAEYAGEPTKLESNPVYVTVVPPQNAAEREAANLIMSREAGMFLASGRDERGEGSRRLTALERQYGLTYLAPYARLALAIAESRDRFDPQTKTFLKDGCERATEQLARAVPEVGDPMLAATGTTSWVRCLRQLGREKEVNSAVSTFWRSHPEAKGVAAVTQSLGSVRQE